MRFGLNRRWKLGYDHSRPFDEECSHQTENIRLGENGGMDGMVKLREELLGMRGWAHLHISKGCQSSG